MSCITIEEYSRNVTRRFVGWFAGSMRAAASSLGLAGGMDVASGECDLGVVGDDGGVAGVDGVCDYKHKSTYKYNMYSIPEHVSDIYFII